MDRRQFLGWSASRAGLLSLVFLGGATALIGPGAIQRHLDATFGYLILDRADLDRFARAYIDTYGHPGEGQWPEVESTFLLSTDFFTNGADESVPVRFLAIHHAYSTPCLNPLASFDP